MNATSEGSTMPRTAHDTAMGITMVAPVFPEGITSNTKTMNHCDLECGTGAIKATYVPKCSIAWHDGLRQ